MTTAVLTELSESTEPVAPQVPGTTAASEGKQRTVPLTMPSGQEYFWCWEWQEGEREVLAAAEAGDVIRFDSDDPEDVIRWLDESDDD